MSKDLSKGKKTALPKGGAGYFEAVFAAMRLPVILADAETGDLLDANPAALELLGYSVEELRGMHQTQLHPLEQREYSIETFRDESRTHFTLADNIKLVTKSGEILPTEVTQNNFTWEGRRIKVAIFRNVSRESMIEKRLHFLQSIIDTIPHPVFYKNTEGRYVGCNRAFEKYVGLPKERLIGKTVFDITPIELAERYHQADIDLFSNGESQIYESILHTPNQKKRAIRFHKVLFHHEDGSVAGLLGVIEDLSDIKQIENELIHAKEKAEQAAKVKSEFLSTMSHEIRTPLNGIIGMTDALLESPLDDRNREYVGILRQSADALLNIVTNILDSARLEERKIVLESIPFRLEETVSDAVDLMRPAALAKNLPVYLEFEKGIPALLVGDPGRLAQVIVNLLNNSIKFTTSGKIDVKVSLLTCEDMNASLQFLISDTGGGIAPEIIPQLFQPFNQGDHSISRKFGGAGLGLFLSKQIISLMNGKIGVESELEKGTTFIFTLSLPVHVAEKRDLLGESSDTFRILAVEDDLTNQLVIKSILKNSPYEVVVAGSGLEALENIRQSKFDLILMDVQMPEMDGLETTRRIRKMGAPLCDIPIIALTADASRENAERCISVGMNGFLEKPVKKNDLLDELAKVFEQKNHFQFLPSTAKSFLPTDQLLDIDFINDLESAFEKEDFNNLIDTFIETANEQIPLLDRAVKGHEYQNIERIAHMLKGASSNVGALKMSKHTANICKAYHESRFEELEIMAMGLKDILEPTLVALKKQKRGKV